MSDFKRILAFIIITFAVLSVPFGMYLALMLGYSAIYNLIRFADTGLTGDLLHAALRFGLLAAVAVGEYRLVKWLRN